MSNTLPDCRICRASESQAKHASVAWYCPMHGNQEFSASKHISTLEAANARLLSDVARLEGERETLRKALANLLKAATSNVGAIRTADAVVKARAALSPSLLEPPPEDGGVPLASAIGGPSAPALRASASVPDAAAQSVVAAWRRLGKCEDEFLPDYPDACAEFHQALEDAIFALEKALAPTTDTKGEA